MSDGLAFSIDDNAIAAVIDQDLDRTIGTAFIFIKPNWAVTAKHVVTECGVWRQDLRLLFNGGNVAARVLYADPHVDLAVIEVDHSPCKQPLFPAHSSFAGTNGLVTAGCRLTRSTGTNLVVVEVNHVPSFHSEVRERFGGSEEIISFDAEFSETGTENSGAPVLRTGGGVVGVVIEHFQQENRLIARATSIAPLVARLHFREDD